VARARILLADDHKEMRECVVRMLEEEFEILDAVENGEQILEAAVKLRPDVCLLDISMPLINGIEAATRLKEAGLGSKVIFLTIHEDIDFVHAALKSGASGYVMKRRIASDLATAIKEVLAGRIFISASLRNARP
jgi:DNA-binding NarL/FixJ family response regulator